MMADLDLHFGAGLALGVGETARQARWMEELGYEYISAGEHFMRGDPPGPTHASLPILGVAAGAGGPRPDDDIGKTVAIHIDGFKRSKSGAI